MGMSNWRGQCHGITITVEITRGTMRVRKTGIILAATGPTIRSIIIKILQI
jgi:hypothetical protein